MRVLVHRNGWLHQGGIVLASLLAQTWLRCSRIMDTEEIMLPMDAWLLLGNGVQGDCCPLS